MQRLDIIIESKNTHQRLDSWCKESLQGVGFGAIQKHLRLGHIKINAKKAKPDYRLQQGDTLTLYGDLATYYAPKRLQPTLGGAADYAFIESIILYEDQDLLVLNKPTKLHVQGGRGIETSLDKQLNQWYYKKYGHSGYPRLTHRLDSDTTGVLLVGKTRSFTSDLIAQFKAHTVHKTYLALCKGSLLNASGVIKSYLKKIELVGSDHNLDYKVIVSNSKDPEAKYSETHYEVVEQQGDYYWVRFKPTTGRMHQLRVHAQSLGIPIYGDKKYSTTKGLLHLHAHTVSWKPVDMKSPLHFTAPLSDYFELTLVNKGFHLNRLK